MKAVRAGVTCHYISVRQVPLHAASLQSMLQSIDHTTYDTRKSFRHRLFPGINTVITDASARQFLDLYRVCIAIRLCHTWQCAIRL